MVVVGCADSGLTRAAPAGLRSDEPLTTYDATVIVVDGRTVHAAPGTSFSVTIGLGKFSVFAGCNHIGGTYQVMGPRVSFSIDGGSTRECGESLARQQALLLRAFEGTPTVTLGTESGQRILSVNSEAATLVATAIVN